MKTWDDFGIDTLGYTAGQHKLFCPQCRYQRKPEHRNKRELSANFDTGVFQCWHCGFSGSLGWDRPMDTTPAYVRPSAPAEPTFTTPGQDFLAKRKINLAVAREAGVWVDKSDRGLALALPYHRDGQVVHIKYRALADKAFWSSKDTEHVFYGLDWCADADTVVVVEGELDALAVRSAGHDAVLSVPDGAPGVGQKAGAKLACMASAEAIFERATRVVIATDSDGPGETLADELARRIGAAKCARVQWPDGCKDAGDVLREQGPEALKRLLADAPFLPVQGIVSPLDLEGDLLRAYDGDVDTGVGFGFPLLDEYYRVAPGYLTIVTGIPSHGKTTLLDQLLVRLMQKHDYRIAIFSPEQSPNWRHLGVLAAQYTGKPMPHPRYQRSGVMTKEELREANRWLNEHVTFIEPEEPTLKRILTLARIEVLRHGINGLVIDPWNEIEHENMGASETLYVSSVLAQIRRFARDNRIHVWLVAHPTKLKRNEDGTEPVPGLGDISGSAAFRTKADVGLTIWRDTMIPNNDRVTVRVTKMRFLDFGRPGEVEMGYDFLSHRFYELAQPTQQKGF